MQIYSYPFRCIGLGCGRDDSISPSCLRALEKDIQFRANYFVLRRTRRTASQVGLSAAQRKRNVAGPFRCRRPAVTRFVVSPWSSRTT